MSNAPSSIRARVAPLSLPARPELTGGRRVGVLLSHGFTGSPASVRPWAEAVAEHGYGVEVPRLPGHGTRWQELNRTRWADWYAEVARVFEKLAASHDAVVVGGLSMGGALALQLAADQGSRVAGVVVVNPAVATTRKDVLALPLIKWVLPSLPAIANDIKKPGTDEVGYPRTPLKATHSMMSRWKRLREDLPKVTSPLLAFRSETDHVVDPSSMEVIRSRVSSRDLTERVLTDSYHVATLDNDAPQIFSGTVEFLARVTSTS